MKRIGRAPYLATISASFFTLAWNAPSSCGWIGHWLQSIMITHVELPAGRVEDDLVARANEYFPMPFRLQVRRNVVPVEPRPADGDRHAARAAWLHRAAAVSSL